MLRTRTITIASCLVLLSGCSLLTNTDEYRAPGPSGAVIAITPANPRTLDDLTVEIVTEASDPFEESVTYTYAWTKSTSMEPASETSTLDHALTTRDEVWTVTVTPIADRRRGVPVQATVTIANTPPSLSYAGLSRYDLFRDENVEVFFGPTSDADGDAVTPVVRWKVNGAVVPNTATSLSLPSLPATGAEQISVIVTPSDGTDSGEPVTVGPARVRAPGTQWRPLVPPRNVGGSSRSFLIGPFSRRIASAYDPSNRRWLHFIPEIPNPIGNDVVVEVWEYATDVRRWSRLAPAHEEIGEFILYGSVPYVDVSSSRVVFHDPARHDRIVVFDIAQRGSESWESLPLSADSEMPRNNSLANAATVFDTERERLLLYGGHDSGPDLVENAVWSLHVGRTEATWRRIGQPHVQGPIIGATWMLDAARDIAYLAGGAYAPGSNAIYGYNLLSKTEIWKFDLQTNTFADGVVAHLDAPVVWGSGVSLPEDRAGWLVQGAASADRSAPSRLIRRFDFDTFAVTTLTLSGDPEPLPPTVTPAVAYDPSARRVQIASNGGDNEGNVLSTFAITADGALEALDTYGGSSPPAVTKLNAMPEENGDMTLYFGRRDYREIDTPGDYATNGIWTFTSEGRFARRSFDGPVQSARFGYGFGTNDDGSVRVFLGSLAGISFNQMLTANTPLRANPWRPFGSNWDDDYAGAVVHACDASKYVVYGGATAVSGTRKPLSSFDFETCAAHFGSQCVLTQIDTNLPTPRVGAAAFKLGGKLVVMGGAGVNDTMYYGDPCASAPQTWTSVTLAALPNEMATVRAFALDEHRALIFSDWGVVGVLDMTNLVAPTYSTVSPSDGVSPPARSFFATAFFGNRVLLYGGNRLVHDGSGELDVQSDLWELRLEALP